MIKISILYPNNESSRFDTTYYIESHIPLTISLLGTHPGFQGISVELGICGTPLGSEPHFIAICNFLFKSADDFLAAFTPNSEALRGGYGKLHRHRANYSIQ
ncbi:EthD family reductase [Methylococcus mesophilus]|uniref:EthD family reductase n=1 Tax=Methylococcus mesophilus TaxID=2993564 RepID=UPI00224B8E35|nr:EthD family reductase [Methylococcus mesophilus]UZR31011.1 EthD family reductase [Methylococcus mesophilus]